MVTVETSIEFITDMSLDDVFISAQKSVGTQKAYLGKGIAYILDEGIGNRPGVGASCNLAVYRARHFHPSKGIMVKLRVTESNRGNLHGIASKVLACLGVSEFRVFDHSSKSWHNNLDFLSQI